MTTKSLIKAVLLTAALTGLTAPVLAQRDDGQNQARGQRGGDDSSRGGGRRGNDNGARGDGGGRGDGGSRGDEGRGRPTQSAPAPVVRAAPPVSAPAPVAIADNPRAPRGYVPRGIVTAPNPVAPECRDAEQWTLRRPGPLGQQLAGQWRTRRPGQCRAWQ